MSLLLSLIKSNYNYSKNKLLQEQWITRNTIMGYDNVNIMLLYKWKLENKCNYTCTVSVNLTYTCKLVSFSQRL